MFMVGEGWWRCVGIKGKRAERNGFHTEVTEAPQSSQRRGEEEKRARFIVPLHAVGLGVAAGPSQIRVNRRRAASRGGGRSWRGGGRGGCGIRVRRGRSCGRRRGCIPRRRRGCGAGWCRA